MKTLLLLRHAKSDWADTGQADRDRPLASRGERAAALVGEHLARTGLRPDRILCSSARRTRETLGLIREHLPPNTPAEIQDELYLATPGEILACVARLEDSAETALVIGHNPGIAQLATGLAGSGDADALTRAARKFPTAALVTLCFDVDGWDQLAPGSGRFDAFVTPKELDQGR